VMFKFLILKRVCNPFLFENVLLLVPDPLTTYNLLLHLL
jgi:hypothetical protein